MGRQPLGDLAVAIAPTTLIFIEQVALVLVTAIMEHKRLE